jgi:transposase-like protein
MSRDYGFSDEFKKATVQKLLSRGSRKVQDIANEAGIKAPTLYVIGAISLLILMV